MGLYHLSDYELSSNVPCDTRQNLTLDTLHHALIMSQKPCVPPKQVRGTGWGPATCHLTVLTQPDSVSVLTVNTQSAVHCTKDRHLRADLAQPRLQ